jgi:hypothetical protein
MPYIDWTGCYLRCPYCEQTEYPVYDEEDQTMKFPSFFKKKPVQRPEPEVQMETDDNIPGDSAYQPVNPREEEKTIGDPALQTNVVETILLQCPGCYTKVPPAKLLVIKNEGRVIAQYCEQCLSRVVLWAVKSSLGFVLSPPNPAPEEKLPSDGDTQVCRSDESMH